MRRRLVVIGLDCAAPALLFDRFRDDLPVLGGLAARSAVGRMRSCDPPITIPAWAVMWTGQPPGRLGLYGFRHRRGASYTDGWLATSQSVTAPTVWDHLGAAGRPSVVIGSPPGYPVRPIHGCAVGCFITPPGRPYAYPPALQGEIAALVGEYRVDVPFRVEDRTALLDSLYDMTARRLRVVRHLLRTKPWDLFHWMEIGTDRAHHAFWKFMDPEHPRHVPGHPLATAIRDYYRYLDREIGELLGLLPDDALVLVVSDHGAKRMKGAFCVNEWLIAQGELVVRRRPDRPLPVEAAEVDWSRTRAWGWGGYYARIFFNVTGREAAGIVPPAAVPALARDLAERLRAVPDASGAPMATTVFAPGERYPEVRGDAPDLMVYFDDLSWRSAGTVGHPGGAWYLDENDTGPDDAVHDYDGVFILYDPRDGRRRELGTVDILDVAPTVLDLLGLPVPADLPGRPLGVGGAVG